MSVIVFDINAFRNLFPAFLNATRYPDAVLQARWDTATIYISDQTGSAYCGGLSTPQQTQTINLMTAHLQYIADNVAKGGSSGLVQSANVGGVSVSLTPPPVKGQWAWWLSQSPYGQQLLALLNLAGVGGMYIPGRRGFASRSFGGGW